MSLTAGEVIPISLATLSASESVAIDLYIKSADDGQITLYRRADIPLETDDLERLRARGIRHLFIRHSDRTRYQEYLRSLADGSLSNGTQDSAAMSATVNEVVLDVLESAFASGDDDRLIASANELGTMTARLITSEEFATNDLLRVLRHDYATFTHSANVAFYAGILARKIGFATEDVQKIVAGGLLHDIGKLEIDSRILCKPARLNDREFREIARHPTVGFRRLARRSELTAQQLLMVYQHHERLDGKGYPTRSIGSEIDVWAKICSVVDVYEALTSFRPYRSPMTRKRAIEVMTTVRGTAFDPELLSCWQQIIQNCSTS